MELRKDERRDLRSAGRRVGAPIVLRWIGLALLGAFALAVSLEYGRRGYMPLDQSITFDGGWRVLSGQVPFRDFATPSGVVPILLQALLFRLFGVSWFVYCLHAALFNAAFAVWTYGLLRTLGESAPRALLFGALAALSFYPPAGVPSHEHHSFALGLLAVWLSVLAGGLPSPWRRRAAWSAASFALVLAFFSKQVPAVFLVPLVCCAAWCWAPRRERISSALALAAGAVCGLALFGALAVVWGAEWGRLSYAMLELPGSTGAGRLEQAAWARAFLAGPRRFAAYSIIEFGLLIVALAALHLRCVRARAAPAVLRVTALAVPFCGLLLLGSALAPTRWVATLPALGLLLLAALVGAALYPRASAADSAFGATLAAELPLALLAAGLIAASVLFIALTNNHPGMGVAYVFPALGLTQLAFRRGLAGAPATAGVERRGSRAFAAIVAALMLLAGALDAVRFHRSYTVTRGLNDFRRTPVTEDGAAIAPSMAFLRLALPEAYADPSYGNYTARHYRDVIDFFAAQRGSFFLVGDSSILYALTGRPSLNPVLWFHHGLTLPQPASAAWERYEAELLENMRRHDCRYILLETKGSWMGTHLMHFKRLARSTRPLDSGGFRSGPFQAIPIELLPAAP